MHPAEHAARRPNKAAVVMAEGGDRLSYRDLDERSNASA